MKLILPDDKNIVWKNIAELTKLNGCFRPQRAPQQWVKRFAEGAAWRCLQGANVRMLLKTDSRFVGIRWKNAIEWGRFEVLGEVYCNGKICTTFSCNPTSIIREDIFETTIGGENLWEIHFPWCAEINIESILIDRGAKLFTVPKNTGDIMFVYGSSITQGFNATRASGTWPYITASLLGIDFYNFGLGGAAFYEKEIAEFIASRSDWKYLTVEAGTNTSGGYETPISYRKTLNTFLNTIREKHPDAPILCFTSTYFIDHDEKGIKNNKGYLMEDYRAETREVLRTRMKDDNKIFLAEGLDWVGSGKYLSDIIHPDDEGMRRIGTGVAEAWRKTIFFSS
ncbi:MAG TPA: SGNH/GDSL hydrolase family protein [bacterium]|nr:SGNH/GDSL hydrolase family protein [bacterium]HPP30445.1 SGNH/GDSL hydrolase family protein [bacterium]